MLTGVSSAAGSDAFSRCTSGGVGGHTNHCSYSKRMLGAGFVLFIMFFHGMRRADAPFRRPLCGGISDEQAAHAIHQHRGSTRTCCWGRAADEES